MADTVFKVELRGIELPKEMQERIEVDIRRAVLAHLGALDLKGDLTIAGRLGPGLAGIIAELSARRLKAGSK